MKNRFYRSNYIIYAISFLLVFIAYGVFIPEHFSSDSYANILVTDAQVHLNNGRIIPYLIQSIFNGMNLNIVKNQSIFMMIFILCLSIVITNIYILLNNIINTKLTERKILLYLGVYLGFVNVFFSEQLLYVESIFIGTLRILIIGVLINYFSKPFNTKNLVIIFLLSVIELNIYQIDIQFLVIYTFIFVYIKNKLNISKKTIIELFVYLFVIGTAALINIFLLSFLKSIGIAEITSREMILSVDSIINNLKIILLSQVSIFGYNYKLLPKYLYLFITIVTIYNIGTIYIRTDKEWKDFLFMVAIIFFSWGIIFLPHFLTETVWLPQRTLAGIFLMQSMLIFYMVFLYESNNIKCKENKIYLNIMVIYVTLNLFSVNNIACDNRTVNAIDYQYAYIINQKILEYEVENKANIYKIATINDDNPTWTYSNIKTSVFDTNIRVLLVPWGSVNLINYVSGRDYMKVDFPEDIKNNYFNKKNWDYFDISNQMIILEDTAYIIMY